MSGYIPPAIDLMTIIHSTASRTKDVTVTLTVKRLYEVQLLCPVSSGYEHMSSLQIFTEFEIRKTALVETI